MSSHPERAPPASQREELIGELHRAACDAIPDPKKRADAMLAVWLYLHQIDDREAITYLEQEMEAMQKLAEEVRFDSRFPKVRLVAGTAAAIGYLSTKLM
jgi:hypothetical protein